VTFERTRDRLASMLEMAWDLTLQRYPSFVYGRRAAPDELPPVLCFHHVEADAFERMARYLNDTRSETLTCDEYYGLRRANRPIPERSVLLTFDDGHLSVWSIAYPLLKKYGLKATTFLIPGRMAPDTSAPLRPTLDDVWAGRASARSVEESAEGYRLCTWSECRAMMESGVMDLQSHTLRHEAISTSSRIVGFVQPTMLAKFCPFDSVVPPELRDGPETAAGQVGPAILGMPIYRSASRMERSRAYRPSPVTARACIGYVHDRGGEAFFQRPRWEQALRAVARNATAGAGEGEWETERQGREAILDDLTQARRKMMEHLPGQPVRHLAYPWGAGSSAAIDASREAGYVSNFWGRVDRRLRNHRDHDPYRWARIGEDFFYLLPGQERTTLRRVLFKKLSRRQARATYRRP
jgi:peptidoglycan/xylan/chitin deacetylase (PgdA/CDA1 family)